MDSPKYFQAYAIRETLNIPLKIAQVLDYEQSIIKENISSQQNGRLSCACLSPKANKKFSLNKEFQNSFRQMAVLQQIQLYWKTIDYLRIITSQQSQPVFQIENVNFQKVEVKSGFLWHENTLRLDEKQGILFIFGPSSTIINLSQYLIRSSSNKKLDSFVLSSTKSNYEKILRFNFENRLSFFKCFNSVSTIIDKCLFQKLKKQVISSKKSLDQMEYAGKKMLGRYASHDRIQTINQIKNCTNSFIFPSKAMIAGSLKVQDLKNQYRLLQIQPLQLFKKFRNSTNFKSVKGYHSTIKQSTGNQFVFRFQIISGLQISKLTNILWDIDNYSNWDTFIISSKIENIIQNTNSLVVNQVHQIKTTRSQTYTTNFKCLKTVFFNQENGVQIVTMPIRSLTQPSIKQLKKSQEQHRGRKIRASNYRLTPIKNQTLIEGLLVLEQQQQNQKSQLQQLAIAYFQSFFNLDQYFMSKQVKDCRENHNFTEQSYLKLLKEISEIQSHPQYPPDSRKIILDKQNKNNFQILKKQSTKSPNISKKSLNQPPQIDVNIKRTSIAEQDNCTSFYSVLGVSDWNSKIFNASFRSKSLLQHPSLKSFKKIPPLQKHMEPIQEQTSLCLENKSESSVIRKNTIQAKPYKKDNSSKKLDHKTQSTFKNQAESLKNITPSLHKLHIITQAELLISQKGSSISPKSYISMRFPITPTQKYEYNVMKGDNWNHYLCKDSWQIRANGQFVFTNQQKLKFQNGVLSKVFKKVATNLISGKGFNISLPVEVFSELSIFELTARGMCFAPFFMQKAVKNRNALQRLKYSICFSLGFSLSYLEMAKPFNPILGQTYQAWINGCPFYCQQISHHPPITSYLFIGRGYRIYGNITPDMELSMNSGVGYNNGECVVVFDDNPSHKIYLRSPGGEIQGLTYGQRKFNLSGKGFYYDNIGHYAEIIFNPDKKSLFSFNKQTLPVDSMNGEIYQLSIDKIQNFRSKFSRSGISKKAMPEKPICKISGRYSEQLFFDKQSYFNIVRDQPCMLQQQKYPLISNCNYREDIIYKRKNNHIRSQIEKQKLQDLQRKDRKLRGNH